MHNNDIVYNDDDSDVTDGDNDGGNGEIIHFERHLSTFSH